MPYSVFDAFADLYEYCKGDEESRLQLKFIAEEFRGIVNENARLQQKLNTDKPNKETK